MKQQLTSRNKKVSSRYGTPWILFNVRSRLHWLKATNPNIYRIYDGNGGSTWVCDQAYQKEIDEARNKGLKVELQDNLEEIKELEDSIRRLEHL